MCDRLCAYLCHGTSFPWQRRNLSHQSGQTGSCDIVNDLSWRCTRACVCVCSKEQRTKHEIRRKIEVHEEGDNEVVKSFGDGVKVLKERVNHRGSWAGGGRGEHGGWGGQGWWDLHKHLPGRRPWWGCNSLQYSVLGLKKTPLNSTTRSASDLQLNPKRSGLTLHSKISCLAISSHICKSIINGSCRGNKVEYHVNM